MKIRFVVIAFFISIIIFWFLHIKTLHHSKEIIFTHNNDTLNGILTIPKNKDKKTVPLVIFVHGDGPVPANSYGYNYIWNALAKNGIASMSWSKKGVDKSTGNWLRQSMRDRAEEATAAVNFIRKNYGNQFSDVGLIGFSQGCWVVPKVCANSQNIDFAILVSGAINWKRQSNYFVKKRLEGEGKGTEYIKNAIKENQAEFKIFNLKNSYDDYLTYTKSKNVTNLELISPERFPFIQKNINSDATDDLHKISCPVLGIFGDADKNVNFQESYTTYDSIFSKVIPKSYELKIYPNATHDLLKESIFGSTKSDITTLIKLKLYSEKAFADGFLQKIATFISKSTNHTNL